MKLRLLIFLLFCWLGAYSSLTGALEDNFIPPFRRQKGRFYTQFNTDYYYTDANYTRFFQASSLFNELILKDEAGWPFFHYMGWNLGGGFIPADWLEAEFFARGFVFAQTSSGRNLRLSSVNIRRGKFIFRGRSGVVDRPTPSWAGKKAGVIPELGVSFPFFYLDYQTNQPITDDRSWQLTPGVWLYISAWDILYPYTYLGFEYRSHALSGLLKWQVGTMLKGDLVQVGVATYGFWSVANDTYSPFANRDRVQLLQNVNAGSLKVLSVNPGVMGITGWFSWYIPSYFTFQIAGNMDVNGTRYAKGYSVLASVIIDFAPPYKTRRENLFKQDTQFRPEGMLDDGDGDTEDRGEGTEDSFTEEDSFSTSSNKESVDDIDNDPEYEQSFPSPDDILDEAEEQQEDTFD